MVRLRASPEAQEALTFDFSSSASKMELLGQGEGGGRILSAGSLGSCFTIPARAVWELVTHRGPTASCGANTADGLKGGARPAHGPTSSLAESCEPAHRRDSRATK